MHLMAAPVEPTIDRQSVSLGDVHHGEASDGVLPARIAEEVSSIDCSLFGPQGLPVIRRVVPGPFLRFDERFGIGPSAAALLRGTVRD